ncbi:MAG: hypothetical protein MZU95_15125 [Desulfomicrobium escambiense]|nr:hypothetical protein [Desulfomicrobium escambiense]
MMQGTDRQEDGHDARSSTTDGRRRPGDRHRGRTLRRGPDARRTERDGYDAVQLGLRREQAERASTKPLPGALREGGRAAATAICARFRSTTGAPYSWARRSRAARSSPSGERVDVIGTSQGHGLCQAS